MTSLPEDQIPTGMEDFGTPDDSITEAEMVQVLRNNVVDLQDRLLKVMDLQSQHFSILNRTIEKLQDDILALQKNQRLMSARISQIEAKGVNL